jgi:penicillin-binding protein 2
MNAMDEVARYRMRVLAVVAISLFGALGARLWYLQVMISEQAVAAAASNITRVIDVPAPRGRILDVKGRTLVGNRLTTMITINPRELEEADLDAVERRKMLTRIAVEVNRSGQLLKVSDIESSLANRAFGYYDDIPIALDVSEDLLVFFGERGGLYPGVTVVDGTVRSYLYGDLATHVLGWVGPVNDAELASRNPSPGKEYRLRDEVGKAGVELMFEDDLRGIAGRRVVEVDRRGEIVRERKDLFEAPVPGDDVILTLDIDIQWLAETELERSVFLARAVTPEKEEGSTEEPPDFEVPGGAVVILDPISGSVVAMASYPSYDPNESIGGFSLEQWAELNDTANDLPMFNRAIQGEYAPGSTFKLFTAHAAWHEEVFGVGRVPEADELWDDPGFYFLQSCRADADVEDQEEASGCVFKNAGNKTYEKVDLPKSLTVSSDVYYYTIGESVYINPMHTETAIQDAATRYGLGRKSGVPLPFEQAGFMPTPANREQRHEDNPVAFPYGEWYSGDNVNTAIGQGDVLVTPIQLANAYATFANGGTRMAPTVVGQVVGRDGETIRTIGARAVSQVDIDPVFRELALEGLSGVTADPEGTAYWSFNSEATNGVYFPLEEFPVAAKTGTAEVRGKADTSLFAAFGPVQAPTHVMVAVMEEAGFGSQVAAPLVARVLEPVLTGAVVEAPTAAVRYARSAALPLCVSWHEWITGDTLERLKGIDPTADPESGPVLDADGIVRVRGERVDCGPLVEELISSLKGD